MMHDKIRVQNDLKPRQWAEVKKVKYHWEEEHCVSSKQSSRSSRWRCAALPWLTGQTVLTGTKGTPAALVSNKVKQMTHLGCTKGENVCGERGLWSYSILQC